MSRIPDFRLYKLLSAIERDPLASQRALATKLELSLGSTNGLLRSVVRKGWVRAVLRPNVRVRYVVTRSGAAEKARVSRAYFDSAMRAYEEVRERILGALRAISAEWGEELAAPVATGETSPRKPVVFYAAGRVAEIGYICLPETDLELVGVVDDERTGSFFGFPILRSEYLRDGMLAGCPFGRLVVMAFTDVEDKVAKVTGRGLPPSSIRLV